jgi:hypothetical protein
MNAIFICSYRFSTLELCDTFKRFSLRHSKRSVQVRGFVDHLKALQWGVVSLCQNPKLDTTHFRLSVTYYPQCPEIITVYGDHYILQKRAHFDNMIFVESEVILYRPCEHLHFAVNFAAITDAPSGKRIWNNVWRNVVKISTRCVWITFFTQKKIPARWWCEHLKLCLRRT